MRKVFSRTRIRRQNVPGQFCRNLLLVVADSLCKLPKLQLDIMLRVKVFINRQQGVLLQNLPIDILRHVVMNFPDTSSLADRVPHIPPSIQQFNSSGRMANVWVL